MLTKQDKKELVSNLTDTFKQSSAVILVDYSGLSVSMQQELKSRLAEADAKMVVVKNTLIKLAGKKAEINDDAVSDEVLAGQTAVIYTDSDPISPLQILAKFAKEFEVPQMKVGIVEGKFQSKENLTALSKLPGKDVLSAQAVGAIGAPLYGLVSTLQGNLQKLVFILSEASKK